VTDLEGCIEFWEAMLKDQALLAVSTVAIIEATIRSLEKLQTMTEGRKNGNNTLHHQGIRDRSHQPA